MAEDFQLEHEPPVSDRAAAYRLTRETYKKKIGFYCKFYGYREPGSGPVESWPVTKPLDRKTVERWVRRGREMEPMDLPPLDQPSEMPEWFERVFERKVPEVLEVFGIKKAEGAAGGAPGHDRSQPKAEGVEPANVDASAAAVTAQAEADAAVRDAMNKAATMAAAAGIGFEAALERARQAERLTYFQWQVLLKEPEKHSQASLDRRKKAWEDALDTMRKAEQVAERVMSRSDEWARWSEVEEQESQKLAVVAAGVRSLITRVVLKVAFPDGLYEELNRAYQGEVDLLFGDLGKGGFAPLLTLEA